MKTSDRDNTGKFTAGNRAGKGNPHAAKVARLRAAMLEAVTPVDMLAIAQTLVEKSRGGDLVAIKILLDRLLGAPIAADILERLKLLESTIEGNKQHGNN